MALRLLPQKLFPSLMLILLAGCGDVEISIERSHHPLPKEVDTAEIEPGNYGGVFVVGSSQEPRTFNPLVASDAYSSEAIGQFLSSLTTYDPIKEETIPQLAREWEISEDNLTITMHLRQGVLWSDGEPFTADDVIFTFDCVFDERYTNRYVGQYTFGDEPMGYEKIDDHTVQFTTVEPYSPFLHVIGFMAIMPRHRLFEAYETGNLQQVWTTETALRRPEELVGTGPFRVRSFRSGERIVYEPNPHYWRADPEGNRLPYIDIFINRFVQDQNTEAILFATGQLDTSSISPSDLIGVKQKADLYNFAIYERGPATGISFFWFNQRPGEGESGDPFVEPYKLKWFTSKNFRQAIAYGFNRQGLVDSVYFGRATLLHSIISPANTRWNNPDVPKYPYDPKRALELLQEDGFRLRADKLLEDSEGNVVEFEILAGEGSSVAPQILSSLRENMRDLGITVRVSYLDFGTIIARTSQHFEYEAAMMGFTGGVDPSGGRAIYLSSGRLHVWNPDQKTPATDWEAEVDDLVNASERTFDMEERIRGMNRMQEIFSEQLPLVYLVTPNAYAGLKNKWQNVRVPAMGSIVWNIDELYLEEEK